jgi:hypothetical protein
MPPLRESRFCLSHDPEHAEAAQEARRLGGQRRKREGMLAGAYEFDGLHNSEDLKRLLDIAAYDALALDNSVARVRTLIALVEAGKKLFETTELEERVAQVESVMEARLKAGAGGRT